MFCDGDHLNFVLQDDIIGTKYCASLNSDFTNYRYYILVPQA